MPVVALYLERVDSRVRSAELSRALSLNLDMAYKRISRALSKRRPPQVVAPVSFLRVAVLYGLDVLLMPVREVAVQNFEADSSKVVVLRLILTQLHSACKIVFFSVFLL